MPKILQSFCWWAFQGGDYGHADLLRKARAIGYDAVELIGMENWHLAESEGIAIATHVGHDSIARGLNNPADHARIVNEIRANLDRAVKHSIPNLVVFAGNRWDGLPDSDAVEMTADGLSMVLEDAAQAGVTLVLELLNSKIDHEEYQADHTLWGRAVCQMLDSPYVKLLYDVYHMQVMEGDLINTIGQHHRYIGHYHTGGNPGRGDLDMLQEINYPAVFRAIAATGYTGYIGHEFIPKGDPVEALASAYRLCAEAIQ